MPGEAEHFKVVVEVIPELNNRAFEAALQSANAAVTQLTSRAATVGSGPVTGGGTAGAPNLAAQAAQVQNAVNALATRAVAAAGNQISQGVAAQLSALSNGAVIAQVSAALATRTTGRVSPERFLSAVEREQSAQIAAIQSGTRAALDTAANARIEAGRQQTAQRQVTAATTATASGAEVEARAAGEAAAGARARTTAQAAAQGRTAAALTRSAAAAETEAAAIERDAAAALTFARTSKNRYAVNPFPPEVRTGASEAQFQIDRTPAPDIRRQLREAEVAYSNAVSSFGENNLATVSAAARYREAKERNPALPYAVTAGAAPTGVEGVPVPSREVVGYYRTLAEAKAAVQEQIAAIGAGTAAQAALTAAERTVTELLTLEGLLPNGRGGREVTSQVALPPIPEDQSRLYRFSETGTPQGHYSDRPLTAFGNQLSYVDVSADEKARLRLNGGQTSINPQFAAADDQALHEAILARVKTINALVGQEVISVTETRDAQGRVVAAANELAAAETRAAGALQTLPTAHVAGLADRNVPLDRLAAAESTYLESLKQGTGQFRGRGIAQIGIQNPIQIEQSDLHPQGQITEGHHRIVAAQQLGITGVPVEIRNAQGELISATEFHAARERFAAERTSTTQRFLNEVDAELIGAKQANVAALRSRNTLFEEATRRLDAALGTSAGGQPPRIPPSPVAIGGPGDGGDDDGLRAARQRFVQALAAHTAAQQQAAASTQAATISTNGQRELAAGIALRAAKENEANVRQSFAGTDNGESRKAIREAEKDTAKKQREYTSAQKAVNDERLQQTKQQTADDKAAALEAEEAHKAASAQYIREQYTPVAEAAAAGRPPLRVFPYDRGGGGGGGAPPPRSGAGAAGAGDEGAANALAAYAEAVKRAQAALEEQRAAILGSLVYLRELLTSGQDLISAQAEQAALRRAAAAIEKQQTEALLATDRVYIEATAEAANLRRAAAARTATLEREGVGLERVATTFLPNNAALLQASDAELRTRVLGALAEEEAAEKVKARLAAANARIAENELLAREENVAVLAAERASNNKFSRALQGQTNALEKQAYAERVGTGQSGAPGLVQRLQAYISERKTGAYKAPDQFANLGQVLSSRLLTTAGFAVSGLATYAAFAGLQGMVHESQALERALSQVRAQFDSLGQGAQFQQFRQGIIDIAHDTGTAASEVAKLASAFKGAFGQGAGGNLSSNEVLSQAKSAVEFAKVTGISLADLQNSLIATAKTYKTDVTNVQDVTLSLSQRTGVPIKEIVDGLAVVAPVADQAGLSLETMASFISTAAQSSGRSASQIGENLSRILPEIQKQTVPLIQFFKSLSPELGKQAEGALLSGNSGKILELIGQNYAHLNKNAQDYVTSLIGSRRDTQALIPAFENYAQVLKNVDAAQNSQGTTSQAYARLQDTLAQQLAKLSAAFKTIGEAFLKLGLSEALQNLAKAFAGIINISATFLGFFSKFDDLTQGNAGHIIALVLELTALYKVLKLIGDFQKSEFALGAGKAALGAGEGAVGGGLLARVFGRGAAGAAVPAAEQGLNAADIFGAGAASGAAWDGIGATPGTVLASGRSLPWLSPSGRLAWGLGGGGYGLAARAGGLALGAGTLATTISRLDPSGFGIADLVTGAFEDKGKKATSVENERLGQAAEEDAKKSREDLLTAYAEAYGGAVKRQSGKSVAQEDWFVKLFETGKSDAGNDLASITGIQHEIATTGDPAVRRSDTALLEYRKRQIADKTAVIKQLVAEGKITQGLADDVLNSDNINDFTKFLNDQAGKGVDVKGAEGRVGATAQSAEKFKARVENQALVEAKFLANLITPNQYLAELGDTRNVARTAVQDALKPGSGTNPDQLKTLLEDYKKANDAFQQLSKNLVDVRLQYAQFKLTSSGASPGKVAQGGASAILDQLKDKTLALEPDARFDLSKKYVEAQQQYVEFLLSHAETQQKAAQIIAEGIKLPPEVVAGLNVEIIKNAPKEVGEKLEALAKQLGIQLPALVDKIALAQAAGKKGDALVNAVLGGTLARLKLLASGKARTADPGDQQRAQQTLNAINGIIGSLPKGADNKINVADKAEKEAQLAKVRADAQIAAAKNLSGLTGQSTTQVNRLQAASILAALKNNPKLKVEDQEALADQFTQAQDAVLQDMAKRAKSTKASIAILNKGLPIPPEIREITARRVLRAFLPGNVSEAISNAATALGIGLADELNAIVDANRKGEDAIHGLILAVRKKLRDIIRAAVRLGAAVDHAEFRRLLDAAKALQPFENKGATKDLPADAGFIPNVQQGNTDAYTGAGAQSTDTPQARAEGLVAIQRAQANGDALKEAQASQAAAYVAKRFAKGVAENLQADAQIIDANNQIQDAFNSIATGNLEVMKALVADDPLQVARIDLAQANTELATAKNDEARRQALIHQFNANRSIRDAIIAGNDSQKGLLIAIANARGDVIGAAQIALQQAQEDYYTLIASGVSPESAKGQDAYRNVVTQQAALRDTTISENENDIQFDLDLHKISTAQAIGRLEALKGKAAGDKHKMQDLERKIYELKHQAGQDLQFNLPNIVLPTFYEARRLAQQGSGGFQKGFVGGGQQYTDNRQVSIVVNANTNASPQDIANAVASNLNKPTTFGTRGRLY